MSRSQNFRGRSGKTKKDKATSEMENLGSKDHAKYAGGMARKNSLVKAVDNNGRCSYASMVKGAGSMKSIDPTNNPFHSSVDGWRMRANNPFSVDGWIMQTNHPFHPSIDGLRMQTNQPFHSSVDDWRMQINQPFHSSVDDWRMQINQPFHSSVDDPPFHDTGNPSYMKCFATNRRQSSGKRLNCRVGKKNLHSSNLHKVLPDDLDGSYTPSERLKNKVPNDTFGVKSKGEAVSTVDGLIATQKLTAPEDPLAGLDTSQEKITFDEWDDNTKAKHLSGKFHYVEKKKNQKGRSSQASYESNPNQLKEHNSNLRYFSGGNLRGKITPENKAFDRTGSQLNSKGSWKNKVAIRSDTSSLYLNAAWKSDEVIRYFAKNYVMYILRGLPGSGKSTIAKQIKLFYSDDSAVICSATDFCYNHLGEYEFNAAKLGETHRLCQEKSRAGCYHKKNVIIIDNTNMTIKEFSVYLEMAYSNNYIVNVIPMKEFDVDVCFARNVHQVPRSTIARMSRKFEELIGIYYGWYVSVEETVNMRSMAGEMIQSHFGTHAFKTFMNKQGIHKIEYLFDRYHMRSSRSSVNHSHITAFYSNNGERFGSTSYVNSKIVMENIGRVQNVCIIGLCITPKCLFARVLLSEQQKSMWGYNDSYNGEVNELYKECFSQAPSRMCSNEGRKIENEDLIQSFSSMSLKENNAKIKTFMAIQEGDYLLPNFGVGCTAHITLGVTDGAKPFVSKKELYSILSLELNESPSVKNMLPKSHLCFYSNDYWVIYFKNKFVIPAMFCGTYA